MPIRLRGMSFRNFKAYGSKRQDIGLSGISVLMGANSSGKSTSIQGILALKQTLEGNQEDVDLLLNGKYTALGALHDVVYHGENNTVQEFSLGIDMEDSEQCIEQPNRLKVSWNYTADNDKLNKIGLDSMELQGGKKLRLKKGAGGAYDIESEGRCIPIQVVLENLIVKKIIVKFDADYNEKLISMMHELIKCAIGTSKFVWPINPDRMITSQIEDIANVITTYLSKTKSRSTTSAKNDMMDKLIVLIDKIDDKLKLLDDTLSKGLMMPVFFNLALHALEKSEDFEVIYKKYEDIIPINDTDHMKTALIPFDEYHLQRSREKGRATTLINTLAQYNKYVLRFFRDLRYLGPLREAPKSIYRWNVGADSEYVGPKGEFFTAVLANWQNKKIETILSTGWDVEKCDLRDALYDWCEYLNVAHSVHVQADKTFGITVQISNLHNKESDIMNVGVGTSQVIPVLLMGLLSPRNATLFYEQPELHLHPYSQSRLADFFVAMMKLGRQIIVETHSEYLLHRIRYHLAKKTLLKNEVRVNFFDNKESGTVVFHATMGDNGGIEYPENFVDQNQSLFRELLKISLADTKK